MKNKPPEKIETIVLLTSWLSIWESVLTGKKSETNYWIREHCSMFPEPLKKKEQVIEIIKHAQANRVESIQGKITRIKRKLSLPVGRAA